MLIQIQMLFIQLEQEGKRKLHGLWKPQKRLFPILAFENFVRIVALLLSFFNFQFLEFVLTCKMCNAII